MPQGLESRVIELPDGRELGWVELGDPDGTPVVFFHGTPGSRTALITESGRLAELGVRLIAPDRPGYGLSTFQPGRRLRGWPDDVTALVDHLGLARFAIAGWSGGGPHTAVCARYLADRVTAAAIIGGFCPQDPSKAGPVERVARLSARLPPVGRALFGFTIFARQRWPEQSYKIVAKPLPSADNRIMARPDLQPSVMGGGPNSPTTARAMAQDMALFARDWGFRLEDIAVPVHLWHGTEDFNVPFSHGEYQARVIPGAVLHTCPDEGHWLIFENLGPVFSSIAPPS